VNSWAILCVPYQDQMDRHLDILLTPEQRNEANAIPSSYNNPALLRKPGSQRRALTAFEIGNYSSGWHRSLQIWRFRIFVRQVDTT
jgi:hypothetical protein